MLGRTHLFFGLLLSLLSIYFFELDNTILFCFFTSFGALFPDVDRSSSFLGRRAKFISWFFSHRGFFHSFYAMILFSLLVHYLFDLVYFFAFLTGFFSHLVLDSFTKKGISFFLVDRRVCGRFVSGGFLDRLLEKLFLLLNACLLIVILL